MMVLYDCLQLADKNLIRDALRQSEDCQIEQVPDTSSITLAA